MAKRSQKPFVIKRGKKRYAYNVRLIYLDDAHMKIANTIENLSGFVRIALDQAAGIMAWDMIHKSDPDKYPKDTEKLEDVIDDFNKKYPARKGAYKKCKAETNSQKKPELW